MKTATQRTVISALFAALVCVTAMLIKVPSPFKGYINLGDGAILLSAWILPPAYGALAAGIGSMLADIFSGYAIYAPATFAIKALVAITACLTHKFFLKKLKPIPSGILSGALAEAVMIAGYFIFEGFMYGFSPSLINIPANAVQAGAGTVTGATLITFFEKQNITNILK